MTHLDFLVIATAGILVLGAVGVAWLIVFPPQCPKPREETWCETCGAHHAPVEENCGD